MGWKTLKLLESFLTNSEIIPICEGVFLISQVVPYVEKSKLNLGVIKVPSGPKTSSSESMTACGPPSTPPKDVKQILNVTTAGVFYCCKHK